MRINNCVFEKPIRHTVPQLVQIWMNKFCW